MRLPLTPGLAGRPTRRWPPRRWVILRQWTLPMAVANGLPMTVLKPPHPTLPPKSRLNPQR